MFYAGTKIIVIGSNKKAKASPRVGSIGYVIDVRTVPNAYTIRNMTSTMLHTVILKVLFLRYGYERRLRNEIKHVYAIIPWGRSNSNPKKRLNRLIKRINNLPGKCAPIGVVIVAPVYKSTINRLDLYGILFSKLRSKENSILIGRLLHCQDKVKSKKKLIPNIYGVNKFYRNDKLLNNLSINIIGFLHHVIEQKNDNKVKEKMLSFLHNGDINEVIEIIKLCNILTLLKIKTTRNNIFGNNLYSRLFKEYENKISMLKLPKYYSNLKKELIKEGQKVLSLNNVK